MKDLRNAVSLGSGICLRRCGFIANSTNAQLECSPALASPLFPLGHTASFLLSRQHLRRENVSRNLATMEAISKKKEAEPREKGTSLRFWKLRAASKQTRASFARSLLSRQLSIVKTNRKGHAGGGRSKGGNTSIASWQRGRSECPSLLGNMLAR